MERQLGREDMVVNMGHLGNDAANARELAGFSNNDQPTAAAAAAGGGGADGTRKLCSNSPFCAVWMGSGCRCSTSRQLAMLG